MKKLILAAMVLAIAGMSAQTAKAGDHEWATVGKVLTGVAIGAAVVCALDCEPASASVSYGYSATACPPPAPVACSPTVVYVPRPVVIAPAPVVVYRQPTYVVAQRPFVSVNFAYGYGHSRGHGRPHHRW